jgi:hypothetical protein
MLKSIQESYGEFLTIKETIQSHFIDFTGGRHAVFTSVTGRCIDWLLSNNTAMSVFLRWQHSLKNSS